MEVDKPTTTASSTGGSGFIVTLHPLVIMNVSDHFMRIKSQSNGKDVGDLSTRLFGAMIGTQSGREIEIFNSFEVKVNQSNENSGMTLDRTFFVGKQEQYRQVFPKYDFLGWYSIGVYPSATDVSIHQQFFEFNESPLFLQLNPLIVKASRDLPLTIYESVVDLVDGQPRLVFVKAGFKIETGEAERIAVDFVARASGGGASAGGALTAHLTGQRNAIKMLHTRMVLLEKYVRDVESGVLPMDHELMRQISSVVKRLPTLDGSDFRKEFLIDYNDVLLGSYLATITKGVHGINELVDKINTIGEKKSGGGGGGGGRRGGDRFHHGHHHSGGTSSSSAAMMMMM